MSTSTGGPPTGGLSMMSGPPGGYQGPGWQGPPPGPPGGDPYRGQAPNDPYAGQRPDPYYGQPPPGHDPYAGQRPPDPHGQPPGWYGYPQGAWGPPAPRARAGTSGGAAITGIFLVLIGVWFLFRDQIALDIGRFWPALAVGLGILMVLAAFIPRRR